MASTCSECGDCAVCLPQPEARTQQRLAALVGNPNVGKSTIFNALTGLRQKVGNYPGVTVERKTGRLAGPFQTDLIDLPGAYSLTPRSLDEAICVDVILGRMPSERRPDVLAVIVDATNLERNLYLALQLIHTGLPVVVVVNMIDEAERAGIDIDLALLEQELGVPVLATSAANHRGLVALRNRLVEEALPVPAERVHLAPEDQERLRPLAEMLRYAEERSPAAAYREVVEAIAQPEAREAWKRRSPAFYAAVEEQREALRAANLDPDQYATHAAFAYLASLVQKAVAVDATHAGRSWTDAVDRWLTHPTWGALFFVLILAVIFQAVYAGAAPAMDAIDGAFGALGEAVRTALPPGLVANLLVEGVVAGVGSVLIFLPQILLLFFFIGLLEDTGYMARAAFVADRLMGKLGLSGRSVVPLVSGYACAVPAIMATRTIDNHQDRLVTMMVIPLMSCSARLPIYALFIAAFIPAGAWLGVVNYQGFTLFALYLVSTAMALGAAWVLKKRLGGGSSLMVLELPVYRRPNWRYVGLRLFERARLFVVKAGRIIFFMSIVLWFLASFPEWRPGPGEAGRLTEEQAASEQVRNSFIGRAGRAIEPVMQPLGFDWKISAGLITAFAAREVLVSTLATIYSVGGADENSASLHERLRSDTDPETGARVFSPLVAVSVMVFFMLACQCMSTLAITRRETNSWRWPAFMFGYMTALAYVCSLLVYQGGLLLGLG